MQQFYLTVAMGKRLIGRAMTVHPAIAGALHGGTIVIIAGTTNSYIVEEMASKTGQKINFNRRRFFRGITLPAAYKTRETGQLEDNNQFPGDVIIKNGVFLTGKVVNDIVSDLKEGDVIIKGGNALDPVHRRAAILIGNSQGGTILASLPAVVGRRVRLIIPIGLEKRIYGDLDRITDNVNLPGHRGFRLLPVLGEVVTEIEALTLLTGVRAEMIAAGGVGGAEGGVWLSIDGSEEQERRTERIIRSVSSEPPFTI